MTPPLNDTYCTFCGLVIIISKVKQLTYFLSLKNLKSNTAALEESTKTYSLFVIIVPYKIKQMMFDSFHNWVAISKYLMGYLT